jgi:hypothetical protein
MFILSNPHKYYFPISMAQAKDWPTLVLPALLVGVFGYATATAVALSLGPMLIKLAAR